MGTVGISPWFLSNLCRGQESRECYHYNSLDNSRHTVCLIRGVDINSCITPGLRCPPPGVLISKFADDMAAWAIQKQEKRVEKLIQKHLDSLSEWCNKWKIKLNPSKTQVGLFTHSNNTKEITLNLGRVPLTVSNEIKFLGLTFDRKLTWRHHNL